MSEGRLSKGGWLLLFISLSLGTFMMVLDYSIANVSIPYIAGDLAVSTEQGTYVITSFAVGNAIGLAMTGWLTKRVGEIRLITSALALFTLLSWLCGLSFSLEMLVICRFIQGFVAGPVIPLSQSLILSEGSRSARVRNLAFFSTIVITAPVVGPILGGYISDLYHWSWIFYINIPVGIVITIVIYLVMRKFETPIVKERGDIFGLCMLAIGVSCLQILLDKGQQWDWLNSNLIVVLGIGAILAFALLAIHALTTEKPLIDLRLFKIPSFAISIVAIFFSYGIYFGTIVLVPLWLQEFQGYDAEWAGLAVSALGIGPILFTALAPRLIQRIGNVKTLMIGFTCFCIGSFYSSLFTTEVDFFHIALARFIFGLGFICYIAPLLAISVEGIEDARLPSATGLFHFVRAMVGAIGTSVFTTIWQRRTYFHHERVGSALTQFNPVTPENNSEQQLALLNNALDQQAALLAINDCFYLMGYLFVGLVLMLIGYQLYLRRKVVSVKN